MPPRRRTLTTEDYFQGVRAGDTSVLARALTLVESSNLQHQLQAEELLTRLMPFTGKAIRVGITGTPGAGKSTFIEALGLQLVRTGHQVAVLAIDPSSDITGGSILGDKTRMPNLAAEPHAYIRPTASAGTLGGAARRTRESMLVCEAADYDVILIETVGVGQSESYVSHMTDCLVALVSPAGGDELQGIKRGLLEVVDFLVVNKADGELRTACEVAARQYRNALETISGGHTTQNSKVFTASALQNEGIDKIWTAVEQRVARLKANGTLAAHRQSQNRHWLWAIVEERLRQSIYTHADVAKIRPQLEQEVLAGTISVEAAARKILDAYGLRN
ncbi:methylmalonyl Co-A mutase-associated GTPase MeaB [Bythopirellula goksoeyrii]|uniref:Putative GTPase ArgK n=1 Tax=Bythopirellula goksoeyrii TaxID=1400387 RepID=A0A5B9QHU7_9BACT|nr:methylmalonyl Co-A mutase-associated GTPase MeaB [Bythopirellula goksoeyrii]QEG33801.1 putative GTPase ArgK [Bythopirellula goksoeyrii]